jgi:hypothetical protein
MTDHPKKQRGHQPGVPKSAGRKGTGINPGEPRSQTLSGKISITALKRWQAMLARKGFKTFGEWAEAYAKDLPDE